MILVRFGNYSSNFRNCIELHIMWIFIKLGYINFYVWIIIASVKMKTQHNFFSNNSSDMNWFRARPTYSTVFLPET